MRTNCANSSGADRACPSAILCGPDRAASRSWSQHLKCRRKSGHPRNRSTRSFIWWASRHATMSRTSSQAAIQQMLQASRHAAFQEIIRDLKVDLRGDRRNCHVTRAVMLQFLQTPPALQAPRHRRHPAPSTQHPAPSTQAPKHPGTLGTLGTLGTVLLSPGREARRCECYSGSDQAP